MLSRHELARVAVDYGAAENQIRRDHLISHVLHALAELDVPLVFFGGTALARTHLTTAEAGGRLSEDIDSLPAIAGRSPGFWTTPCRAASVASSREVAGSPRLPTSDPSTPPRWSPRTDSVCVSS